MPSLARYRSMRDFSRTEEPRGKPLPKTKAGYSFVIQKHAARHLHYDFRLELDGVLLSWAVPKGPSLDPSVKRLAMEVEPHPLEYGGFEGTIPAGEYGGGTVMVWDRGSWTPEGDPREALEKGRLSFELHGQKLRGAWHLVRTKRVADDGHGNKPTTGTATSRAKAGCCSSRTTRRRARATACSKRSRTARSPAEIWSRLPRASSRAMKSPLPSRAGAGRRR